MSCFCKGPRPLRRRRVTTVTLCAAILLWAPAPASSAAGVVVKMGTIAPEGSIWHDALLKIRQRWRDISGDEVELRIYAGGVLGGEAEMVRKLQRRGLDAITISGSGLARVDSSLECLNAPLMFDSYEELYYVREALAPRLEQRLAQKKIVVLSWAEAGWVHFFAKSPVSTPQELKELRLWTAAGHPQTERLFKEFGFQVVPLPMTDMLTGLQTGLIEAIDAPPLFALLDRSYQVANYMLDLKFAPLNAATVIRAETWQQVPDAYREQLREATRQIAADLRNAIRQAGEDAVSEMSRRGLNVIELDAAGVAAWRAEAESAHQRLPCTIEHPQLFEELLRARSDYRRGAGSARD